MDEFREDTSSLDIALLMGFRAALQENLSEPSFAARIAVSSIADLLPAGMDWSGASRTSACLQLRP